MFDKRYKEYVHPTLVNGGVFSCVEDMLPYIVADELSYEFTINGEYYCPNSIYKVLMDAYNYGDMFEIPPEGKSDYSVQELRILRELAIIGEKDRKEYSAAHDYPYLTWNNDNGALEAELFTEIEEN